MSKPGKTRSQENHLQSDLLIGQVARMAELIDGLQWQIKQQHSAIMVEDQQINNLNKAMVAKDQHIAYLEELIRNRDADHYQNLMNLTKETVKIKKYSVFYNLLLRFRRELLKFFGKIQK